MWMDLESIMSNKMRHTKTNVILNYFYVEPKEIKLMGGEDNGGHQRPGGRGGKGRCCCS